MKIAFSWDDGALEDERLFELHEEYQIPGIFFVPTNNREGRPVISPKTIKSRESKYIFFGGHTYNHTYLTEIPINQVEAEIVDNKKYLEDILGHEVDDFCLPGGKYTDEILKIGFKHYKTIRTVDTMNFHNCGKLIKPTFHFYPRGLKSLLGNGVRNKSVSQLVTVACHFNEDYFVLMNRLIEKEADKENSRIVVWGHSWEIEEKGLWSKLNELFVHVKENEKCNLVKYSEIVL